jgi:hypothetical protein
MFDCRIFSNRQKGARQKTEANNHNSSYISAKISPMVISEEEEIPLSIPSLPPVAGGGEGRDDIGGFGCNPI